MSIKRAPLLWYFAIWGTYFVRSFVHSFNTTCTEPQWVANGVLFIRIIDQDYWPLNFGPARLSIRRYVELPWYRAPVLTYSHYSLVNCIRILLPFAWWKRYCNGTCLDAKNYLMGLALRALIITRLNSLRETYCCVSSMKPSVFRRRVLNLTAQARRKFCHLLRLMPHPNLQIEATELSRQ